MQAFGPTRDCEPLAELTLTLAGKRGEEEKQGALTHLENCSYCQTELAMLHEFEAPTLRTGESAAVQAITARLRKHSPAKPSPWWRQVLQPKALIPASVALAAMILVLIVGLPSRHVPGSLDDRSGAEVMRSQALEAIAPLGDLERVPAGLEWRPVTGASRYSVRLLEVDRAELWSASVVQNSLVLPGPVREKIVPLKTLVWEVSALDPSGAVMSSSGPLKFRLLPPRRP